MKTRGAMGQTGRASSNPIKKSSHRVWERSGQGVTMLCAWTMDSCMDFLRPRRVVCLVPLNIYPSQSALHSVHSPALSRHGHASREATRALHAAGTSAHFLKRHRNAFNDHTHNTQCGVKHC